MVTVEDLKKQVLFEGLDDVLLQRLANKLQVLRFKEGQILFNEGDETKGIYLIYSGKITISKLTSGGWSQTLASMTEGHFLGELSILENRLHEAKAVASEDTVLFLLTKEEFARIEQDDIALSNALLKRLCIILAKNLRRMNDKFLKALVSY